MIDSVKFPSELYDFLKSNTIVEVKGGSKRKSFTRIWMVAVNDRLFARSWNKSKKSWFNEIVKTGTGQIKYGEKVVKVSGVKLAKEDKTNILIDKAYLAKYHQQENLVYVTGITRPEYADFTIEFLNEIDK